MMGLDSLDHQDLELLQELVYVRRVYALENPGVLEAERCKLRCLELKLMKMLVRSRPLEALSNAGAGAETR
jgi:hypothetical protein